MKMYMLKKKPTYEPGLTYPKGLTIIEFILMRSPSTTMIPEEEYKCLDEEAKRYYEELGGADAGVK